MRECLYTNIMKTYSSGHGQAFMACQHCDKSFKGSTRTIEKMLRLHYKMNHPQVTVGNINWASHTNINKYDNHNKNILNSEIKKYN